MPKADNSLPYPDRLIGNYYSAPCMQADWSAAAISARLQWGYPARKLKLSLPAEQYDRTQN